MERALKANRVPKVDQVDKLRENLSGFALSMVPDSVKDIKVDLTPSMNSGETLRESYKADLGS